MRQRRGRDNPGGSDRANKVLVVTIRVRNTPLPCSSRPGHLRSRGLIRVPPAGACFFTEKECGQRPGALAKCTGRVRVNICAISDSFSPFSPGAEPGMSISSSRFTSKPRVAPRCFARAARHAGSHERRTSPDNAPRSTRAGARPARQHHRAPAITRRNPLPVLARHRLRPDEKLHPTHARPRRPALPEVQRSKLSASAVT